MTNFITDPLTNPASIVKPNQVGLEANSLSPDFACNDTYGNTIKLQDYRGKKILLSFHRNAGCPICNLRFHEIECETEFFKANGLIVISIYESSPDNMRKYVDGVEAYSVMIPDPSGKLYKLYRVEQSTGKVLKGLFHGAMKKAKQGMKLQNKTIKQDGNLNRVGADFLINEEGVLVLAHYGDYIGHHLSMSEIKKFAGL